MAEDGRVDVSEKVNPPVPTHSQPPPAHAPPPPTPAGSTDSSPRENGCARPTNTAYVHGSPFHQPISATTSPHDCPSSTGDLPVPRAGPVRTSSCLYTGPSCGLCNASTIGLPGIQCTCSDSPPNRGASPYPSLQPHVGLSYQALPPINTTFHEPGTSTHAAQFASPTHFFPEADAEQELSDARPDARYGDCSLFPGMRLPPKFRIPEFKTYEGMTDPRHHLRHYRGKMLQYWEYEEFVIHSFQDSLSGSALDWLMSLRAEDIPTWEDLSRKFIDQYQYCAEAPPTLLELSTKEMAQGQRFEEYATKWRAQAGKKLDLGIKLGRMEGPASKGEESSKKVLATSSSSGGRRGKEVSVNAVNTAHQMSQQYSVNLTITPTTAPTYFPPPPQHQPQSIYYSTSPVPPPMTSQPYDHYTPASVQPPQPKPSVSRAPSSTQ
ncbi:hypothetical protein CRG98_037883 [Punica granatum]|uniref:Retrotransposon gag domain-containing protein n=1 Tax=Punica granatum TaxID=22663 RepID=A0A2I0ICK7_PUNGR|nr:hypothetical protein CRG98_037883 [Punica granatum]